MKTHLSGERKDGRRLWAGMWDKKIKNRKKFENRRFQIRNQGDHKSSPSARIEPRFCTVAAFSDLKIFCLDRFEGFRRKKLSFPCFGLYLARARARPSWTWCLRPFWQRGTRDSPHVRAGILRRRLKSFGMFACLLVRLLFTFRRKR